MLVHTGCEPSGAVDRNRPAEKVMEATQEPDADASGSFRHEALLYRGPDDLVTGVATYARESLAASEPVLLALPPATAELLQDELREDVDIRSDELLFVDITAVGRNPSRIIPACREFLAAHQDGAKRVRAVGESMWVGRSAAEVREVQRHETLLARAFGFESLSLLCPYDVQALPADVVDEAYRVHPYVLEGGRTTASRRHEVDHGVPAHLDTALPPPAPSAREVAFGHGDLSSLRGLVGAWAAAEGMARPRADLLVFAVNELTTNSIEHGGGKGRLLLWRERDSLVAEVRDAGHIASPLVGRVLPEHQQGGGRGVWLVNQVCDLVEIRSRAAGTVIRARMTR